MRWDDSLCEDDFHLHKLVRDLVTFTYRWQKLTYNKWIASGMQIGCGDSSIALNFCIFSIKRYDISIIDKNFYRKMLS